VNARVVPTGVTQRGNAQIPRDGDVIGWYEYGAAPGDARGSTVLIGHRDTRAEGPGALFDLDELNPGARVRVTDGKRSVTYRVVELRSIDKAGLPDTLFRRGGPHQLVLITCGGAYLPEAGGYQENLFAVAVPEER
jgi:LPXTG-site transpeptidase (sortase) family protein